MEPSVPTPKAKIWFPWFKLSIFFVVVISIMYFTLMIFDPGIERDPKEWENQPNKKSKQIEWMLKLMKPKGKK